jgi:hypothetical protein
MEAGATSEQELRERKPISEEEIRREAERLRR